MLKGNYFHCRSGMVIEGNVCVEGNVGVVTAQCRPQLVFGCDRCLCPGRKGARGRKSQKGDHSAAF